jgi:hypothetical protein
MSLEQNDSSLSPARSETTNDIGFIFFGILFRRHPMYSDYLRDPLRLHDISEDVILEEEKEEEAQSARSGYFRTSSKPANIDKFKHRSGPKAQKHR